MAAVQHAFYAGNRDVTREDVLAGVAVALGLARDDFVAVYRAPEIAEATRADFALVQALGIAGFPTVLLQNDEQLTALSAGYQPFAALRPTCAPGSAGERDPDHAGHPSLLLQGLDARDSLGDYRVHLLRRALRDRACADPAVSVRREEVHGSQTEKSLVLFT
jgi:hypothetical protein